MDDRQYTGESAYSVESIRAYEVSRLLNKLGLSAEQREAIDNLSRSLVEQLLAALTEFLAPYRDGQAAAHLEADPAVARANETEDGQGTVEDEMGERYRGASSIRQVFDQ